MICCVGAGPGDLGYLTQRGRELIATADVVAGFTAVVDLIRPLIRGECRIVTMGYKDQVTKLQTVAALHHEGAKCVVVFMGDIHFSGFQFLERVERACGHPVETVAGISAAQILASRCRVCFDETTFITFHRRGDIAPFQEHLVHALQDDRNVIVIPRPWDFMPKTIAAFLLARGLAPGHPTEIWERLTQNEAAWSGTLADCCGDFTDMSMMLIRTLHPMPSQLEPAGTSSRASGIAGTVANSQAEGAAAPQSKSSSDYDIVIAGHGSRDPEGIREFERLVQLVRQRACGRRVSHGFLEFAGPTIDEAVRANIAAGARRVAVVPGVLLAATHAKNDLPSEVLALQQEFPQAKVHYGVPLQLHPLVLKLMRERIIEAEARSEKLLKRSESCLVVVGRGTTDPDANSDVSKLARMLEEGLGFGTSFVCYAGTAKPLVADGLKQAVRLGFPRIVVAPFFLFTGILVKRIYSAVTDLAGRHPEIEFLKCEYLGIHEGLADALLDRADESITGRATANCSLCKYRVQIIGYEKEVGAPQQGHHFHVRNGGEHRNTGVSPVVPTYSGTGVSPVIQDVHGRDAHATTPHPIELESFRIINAGRDWSAIPEPERDILQRLVHTSGDFNIVDEVFISPGAIPAGIRALSQRVPIVTDVAMVQSGLRRSLLDRFAIDTVCTVHDEETNLMAEASGMTRSAAGIRRAWMRFGNHLILAIGDAPTAVEEAVRLVNAHQWRPHLIIALPVGFVGTEQSKEKLRRCVSVPRITNRGTRGGSPWAAAVVNAMLVQLANQSMRK
jgi:precorrin-8X/cobalt-precorrin-8 methylmutase